MLACAVIVEFWTDSLQCEQHHVRMKLALVTMEFFVKSDVLDTVSPPSARDAVTPPNTRTETLHQRFSL